MTDRTDHEWAEWITAAVEGVVFIVAMVLLVWAWAIWGVILGGA